MSFRRQRLRLIKYSLSPFRYNRRVISTSEYAIGTRPLTLLIVKLTSAKFSGRRVAVPLKITSVTRSARKMLAFCSPITQRIASTILVLPQPFGPTIEVIPRPNWISDFLRNDLKP